MKIKSLGLKISIIVAVIIAIIICIIFLIVSMQSTTLIKDLTSKEATAANVSFSKQLENLAKDAANISSIIASSSEVINAIQDNRIDANFKAVLNELGADVDNVMVTDTGGNVLMRMDSDQKGDNVMSQSIVSSTLGNGTGMSMIGKDPAVGLSTRGSAVIKDHSGNVIGAVFSGYDLSNPSHVDEVKEYTGSEVTVFDGRTRLMTTLMDESGKRVVGTDASAEVIDVVMNQKKDYSLQIQLFGKEYYAHYSPLISDGAVLGMLFTGVCIDDTLKDQQSMMNMVLMVGIICGVLCILIVFVFNVFAVSRPLKKIGVFAHRISTGDIGVSSTTTAVIDVRSYDEVGSLARELERSYAQLRGYVGEIRDRMRDLADGDLTTESTYEFHGDFVLIKDSINDHIQNLSQIMADVNSSSTQVSSGAKQVANGAQSLAQGSTEQAASIQELSSSIAEIAEKTKENAVIAGKTAMLTETIKGNAEKGSLRMDEMITAVKDINEASQSISKIIKTIDNIAFQTNILALNAAVEAARAGQHGKGFAVVAEEVRNLASKSAQAAKETGDMIQNSMDKAELGTRIAGETAESLREIVNGINESTLYVEEIAVASEQQSMGISQVNIGIDQVAQVVQQNSATAEESAAASEEMSGQSDMLQQLIAQFKLKNSGSAPRRLASESYSAQDQYPMPSPPSEGRFSSSYGSTDFGKY